MDDWSRPPSGGTAGQDHAPRQYAFIQPAPQFPPLIPSIDIQAAHESVSAFQELQEDLADDNLELVSDFENVTIGGSSVTGIEDVDLFIAQLGPQAQASAGSWNAVDVTETSGHSSQDTRYLTSQPSVSLSTATFSQPGSSIWDASSIHSFVTDASRCSTICEICLTQCNSMRQKGRHRRTVHGKTFRCKCSYKSGRKDNYHRHLKSCRKKNETGLLFTCLCDEQTSVFDTHSAHLQICRLQVGRPSNSSRQLS
ncbi:hypothetical protein K4K49_010290 [Colletotrichum sp. SAR 10_70]|nr:hypothetical protein K4K50_009836 [Colletotrichum sp. SAR 10_71]KAI8193955.1 hypothetical protein K4K49_010290 [Colletotrichum sp. SAR 10_70]